MRMDLAVENKEKIENEEEEDETIAQAEAKEQEIPKTIDPELEEMYKAGVHYGYTRGKRHPKMAEFIFGAKNNVEIFDLDKTREKLNEATDFTRKLGAENKQILVVGTKPSIKHLAEKYAKEADLPYFANRWIGGFLTNFVTLRKRMDYFAEIKIKKESSDYKNITSKKERIKIEKEFARLEKLFAGVTTIKELPSALLIIDSKEENTAVREAKRKKIPVIAVLNTDCDLEDADYQIPANDAAPASVEYLLSKLTKAYLEGKKSQKV